jgi:flagella basal body P-ring formation protein FlgA
MERIEAMTRDFLEKFELAVRIALFIFSVSVGMVVLMVGTKQALAATLRAESIITGDYIKLGDIFTGAKNAEYILGPAPMPGKDMVLNARTLYKIAAALDVDWSPSSSAEQIVLKREASIIPETEINTALEEKVKESGVTDKFSVHFINAPGDIVLPADAEVTLEVTAFNFDAQKDNFNAVVVAPSAENPLKRISVSGRIERLIAVPVLKNSLKNGDIIGAMDIDYIDLPKNRIANGVAMDEKDLVNMTPRRMVHGGKPVIVNELEHPKMVDRGDAVTLIFETGPMILTVKGKSMQAGALGDTVRVSNADSNKNLQGVVTAHREVTIR